MSFTCKVILGALGLVAAGAAPFGSARAWGETEESYYLANGLKVIMVEQRNNPVVSLLVLIRAGAASEEIRAEYGLAHLMEHMAFRGTKRYPDPDEISNVVEMNGGNFNAYTSPDATVYHIEMPASEAGKGLSLLADLVFAPLYDPGSYEMEKEVVVEEIKRSQDNPNRQLTYLFDALAFPDHPYGRPVLGYEETIRAASVERAESFHTKHYRPDNAILVISGGLDRESLRAGIEENFGSIKNPEEPLSEAPMPALSPPAGPTTAVITSSQTALAKVVIGFRGPTAMAADSLAMDLLSSVLSGGFSSRLVERVKDRKKLVSSIYTYSHTPKYQGTFYISFETEPALVLPAVAAVWEELRGLITESPSDREMARAKILAERDYLSGQETAQELGQEVAKFEYLAGDWRLRDAWLPMWNRLDAAEVTRLAYNYLRPKNMTLVLMLPATASGEELITEEDLRQAALKLNLSSPEVPAAAAAAGFKEYTLSNGLKLMILRDASLPLITVQAGTLGGLLADPAELSGLNNFLAQSWTKATEKRNSEELSRTIEDLGARIAGFSGRNMIGLTGSFLSSTWEKGLTVFLEVLTSPAFASADLEAVRPEVAAEIKAQDERLAARTFRLLGRELYQGHPYSHEVLGTLSSLEKIDSAELKRAFGALVQPRHMVLTVAGDVEPDRLAEFFEETLGAWQPQSLPLSPAWPEPPASRTAFTQVGEELDRAQTHLALGFLVPGLGHPDQPVLELLNTYLSGFSGPLFKELRVKRSLAYTVASNYLAGLGTGAFSLYIATDPAKVEQAREGFEAILDDLRRNPISSEELEGNKRFLIGSIQQSLQTLSSRTQNSLLNILFGLGADYHERHIKDLEAVTAGQIMEAVNRYLGHDQGVLAVLGRESGAGREQAGE